MSNTTYIEEVLDNHKDWFEAIETMTSSLPTDEWELLNNEIKGMFKQMLTQAIRDTEVKTAEKFKSDEDLKYIVNDEVFENLNEGEILNLGANIHQEKIDDLVSQIINTNQED